MTSSVAWPRITADRLAVVREPLSWCLHLGEPADKSQVAGRLRRALLGPADETWETPTWLWPHQVDAARRIAGSIKVFGGALLCDAVGLGKTYTGLAIATRYRSVLLSAPAVLNRQWTRVSDQLGVGVSIVSHESLSRQIPVPQAELIIVDEAHWFRNPSTMRYVNLARGIRNADLLLMTATPVVNRPADLVHLVRLFAPDHAFAAFGIDSLSEAVGHSRRPHPGAALTPVIIARSPDTAGIGSHAVPLPVDQPVVASPPTEENFLRQVGRMVERLRFPSFDGASAASLLRLQLFHRLSSSVPACVESLRRHRKYLDHAIDAARKGERLSRRASRTLFATEDEFQLEFDLLRDKAVKVPVADLEHERDRISALVSALQAHRGRPKIAALRQLLTNQGDPETPRKTLVFTNAVATALEIARHLDWRRTAVVAGGAARIVSGPVPVSVVLGWFAPSGNQKVPPPRYAQIDVLVATDMVSEGLNLQDADAVVHFDLPWNPVRLQQRVGRVARMGSDHTHVDVWWFIPPPLLENHLNLRQRIQQKLEHQRDLGVPVTSRVGQARVLGRSLETRERVGGSLRRFPSVKPHYCVVAGPLAAAFAVRWQTGRTSVPQLIVLAGDPPVCITDLTEACGILLDLLDRPVSEQRPDVRFHQTLVTTLRQRLARAHAGPSDNETRRLARMVLRRAGRAGKARRARELHVLDQVLDALSTGIGRGAQLDLVHAMQGKKSLVDRLTAWSHRWKGCENAATSVTLEAAIVGDGTER